MKTNLYFRFPVLVLLLGSLSLHAQDIHFTQFYNSPLTLSPALTGISKGDVRITGIYRSQWNAANSPYKTLNLAVEKKFYDVTHDNWWLSGGLNLYYDKAGAGDFATTHVSLTGSYTRMLDRENFISVGLSAGFGQRRFEFGNFSFDNQWNGDNFDPSAPTGENFSDPNILYPDFGAGFNWRGQKLRKRTKVDVGVGLYHFTRPDMSFQANDKSRLPMRFTMFAMPVFQVIEKGDIVGNAVMQLQGEYFEALASAGYRHHLVTKKSKEVALQLGFGYRFNAIGDALTPAAEVHFRDWMVGFSWDINVSDFSTATKNNGGPEIAIRYIINKVYPLKAFKACPLI